MKNLILVGLGCLLSAQAFAIGNEGAHGGDEVGLDFESASVRALANISGLPSVRAALSQSDLDQLSRVASQAHVLATDESLLVVDGGFRQDSYATNDSATKTIRVNRYRWRQIKDAHVKEALALHEVAGLAGLEGTGLYKISSLYLGAYGIVATAPSEVFTPACGRIETKIVVRTIDRFNVGELSRVDVCQARLRLAQALLKCGSTTKSVYCEEAVPVAECVVIGMREESRTGQREPNEADLAEIQQAAVQDECR